MTQIMQSVGRGGANRPNDVRAIQQLLNQGLRRIPSFRPLAVDGMVGPKTIAAIEMFQRQVMRWGRADGRVDPRGQTLQALNQQAGGAPPQPTAATGPATKPRWIAIAEAELGVKEIAGSRHNSKIVEYHATTGNFGDDETAWCSSFVNWVMKQAGYTGTNSAGARSWARWGKKVDRPAYGAIAVIDWDGPGPGWKGHVGFVVGKSGNSIRLLGGNQSDAVNIKNFGTSKIIAYVFPSNYNVPANAYQLTNSGAGGTTSMQNTR